MNLDIAEKVGQLARQVRELDGELAWLAEQDGASFPSSRICRGTFLETGPVTSVDAAREVRALLRRDYEASKKLLLKQLSALGVEAAKSH